MGGCLSNILQSCCSEESEVEYQRSDFNDQENVNNLSSNNHRAAWIDFEEIGEHSDIVNNLAQSNIEYDTTVQRNRRSELNVENSSSNSNDLLPKINFSTSDYDSIPNHLYQRKQVPFLANDQNRSISSKVKTIVQVPNDRFVSSQNRKPQTNTDSRDTPLPNLRYAVCNSNKNIRRFDRTPHSSAQKNTNTTEGELDNDSWNRSASANPKKLYDITNSNLDKRMKRFETPDIFSNRDIQQLNLSTYLSHLYPFNGNLTVQPFLRVNYDFDYYPKFSQVSIEDVPQNFSIPGDEGCSDVYRIIPISDDRKRIIKRSIINKRIKVNEIEEIENEYLKLCYNLKKQQKLKEYPDLQEIQLFHGTKWANVDSICENNFNWRLRGTRTGNIFGQGVCFSGNAMYAAHYSGDENEKVMFVANVLIGKKCRGTKRMRMPIDGYDTSAKNPDDNIVIVKYEDNEFYPMYRIRFHMLPARENEQKTTRKNNMKLHVPKLRKTVIEGDEKKFPPIEKSKKTGK